jgi:hypothetical protein
VTNNHSFKPPGIAAAGSEQKLGSPFPAPYLDFFQCFNRGEYFAAHEVLEALWLQDKQGAPGDFFKALIQIAGAFVHFKKARSQPGIALLRRAKILLSPYPEIYLGWPVSEGRERIATWLSQAPNPANPVSLPLPSSGSRPSSATN